MRVLLVPNTANPDAVHAARDLAAWLTAAGIEPVLIAEDAEVCSLPGTGVDRLEVGEPALAVALGGDGTILKTVHVIGEVEVPVLGINLGRVGFMAGARADVLRGAVESALAGEGRIERRATLQATLYAAGAELARHRALNEVYVGRGTTMRVIDVELLVNGTEISHVRCDGFVVSTPTGSTAYALSAGGPIVAPDVGCMLVVPVAPHTLTARALVVGTSDRVDLALANPARRDVHVFIDGMGVSCTEDLDMVSIVRGAHDVSLVRLDGRDFFETVRDQFWRGQ